MGMAVPNMGLSYLYDGICAFGCIRYDSQCVQMEGGFLSVVLVHHWGVVCFLGQCLCDVCWCAGALCVSFVRGLCIVSVYRSFLSGLWLCVSGIYWFTPSFYGSPAPRLCSYCVYVSVFFGLRLACPSVPVFSRVPAPGVPASLRLFSGVLAF